MINKVDLLIEVVGEIFGNPNFTCVTDSEVEMLAELYASAYNERKREKEQ